MCAPMCLGLHVPEGGCVVCVIVWLYQSMSIYVSATSFTSRQFQELLRLKPPVCVLPQTVTSLRTVYMCEIQRWLNCLY